MFLLWLRVHRRLQKKKRLQKKIAGKQWREIRDASDPLESLSDEAFEDLFYLSKPIYRKLLEIILPHMRYSLRTTGLSRQHRALNGLRFFIIGFYQRPIGRDNKVLPMSQASVSRCVTEVANILNYKLSSEFLTFPTNPEEKEAVKEGFYEKFNFPGVIGSMTCMEVTIKKPPNDVEEKYRSTRFGFHTNNVQIVCDSNMTILHVNSRHGGSVDDNAIFNTSVVNHHLKEKHQLGEGGNWILGDGKYPQLPWLMTPIPEPRSPQELRYNECHKKAKETVDRCTGVLRSRFRCLAVARTLMYTPEKSSIIINACCVLHNIMIKEGFPLPPEEDIAKQMTLSGNVLGQFQVDDVNPLTLINQGQEIRKKLISDSFMK
ncbi:putative nuclease HARBI1 [Phlebotomus papatasi]|uniref:putative nuclease HARBI1 n=1 Tax=Phlebotomus papatasi TaxID=29031 RepID=UPI002483446B|nr:putative nuclease HARBI1 [Phlebotomus papatasi]